MRKKFIVALQTAAGYLILLFVVNWVASPLLFAMWYFIFREDPRGWNLMLLYFLFMECVMIAVVFRDEPFVK